jgi:RNA polymerase primary sigma factor
MNETMTKKEVAVLIARFPNAITRRSADILKLRFGIADGRTWLQKDIAAKYGFSQSRAHYIEHDSIKKLSRALRDFERDRKEVLARKGGTA